jgi:hypothetical protein
MSWPVAASHAVSRHLLPHAAVGAASLPTVLPSELRVIADAAAVWAYGDRRLWELRAAAHGEDGREDSGH